MRTAIVTICLIVAAAGPAAAESAPLELDLSKALSLAAGKSPAVLMAQERVLQSAERLHQAGSYFLPELSAAGSWTRQTRNLESYGLPASGSTASVVGPFNVLDARTQVTQTLFDLGMVQRLRAAHAGRELTSLQSLKAKEDAMALAGILYLDARRAREGVELSKRLLRLTRQRLLLARTALTQGNGSELSLTEAASQWRKQTALWRSARTNEAEALLDLKALLGLPAEQTLLFAPEERAEVLSLPSSEEVVGHVSASAAVQASKQGVRQQEALRDAQAGDYLPRVSGMADIGANGRDWDNAKETYSFGGKVSWPFFEGGRRQAAVAEAESRVRESRISSEDTERRAQNSAMLARRMLKDTRMLWMAAESQWSHARKNAEAVSVQFQNGSASFMEWLEARTLLARSEDERAEALAAFETARIQMAHTQGQMTSLIKT